MSYSDGVKAMFDYLMYKSANNFHGNPEIQKQCDIENKIIREWAEDALDECDEFANLEWKNIKKCREEIRQLEIKIKLLERY